MAQFIFYTKDRYLSPNNKDVENLQIIGIEKGSTEQEAFKNLCNNNSWIENSNFPKEKIQCYVIFKPEFLAILNNVIDYNWKDEERHFEESELLDNHIFQDLKTLKKSCNY
jgi:hypothetical protein